jgi:hypothetical protein
LAVSVTGDMMLYKTKVVQVDILCVFVHKLCEDMMVEDVGAERGTMLSFVW